MVNWYFNEQTYINIVECPKKGSDSANIKMNMASLKACTTFKGPPDLQQ